MSALVVYSGLLHRHGQVHVVVATTSRAALGRILDDLGQHCSRGELRDYWSETGNDTDLSVATAEPGVVFWRPLDDHTRSYLPWTAPRDDDR